MGRGAERDARGQTAAVSEQRERGQRSGENLATDQGRQTARIAPSCADTHRYREVTSGAKNAGVSVVAATGRIHGSAFRASGRRDECHGLIEPSQSLSR